MSESSSKNRLLYWRSNTFLTGWFFSFHPKQDPVILRSEGGRDCENWLEPLTASPKTSRRAACSACSLSLLRDEGFPVVALTSECRHWRLLPCRDRGVSKRGRKKPVLKREIMAVSAFLNVEIHSLSNDASIAKMFYCKATFKDGKYERMGQRSGCYVSSSSRASYPFSPNLISGNVTNVQSNSASHLLPSLIWQMMSAKRYSAALSTFKCFCFGYLMKSIQLLDVDSGHCSSWNAKQTSRL